jgi:hypothetical protein
MILDQVRQKNASFSSCQGQIFYQIIAIESILSSKIT